MPPHLIKEYHVAVCLVTGYTLRAARDLYLSSLGGAAPSATRPPRFPRSPKALEQSAKHCRYAMKDEGDPRPNVDAAIAVYVAMAESIGASLAELADYYQQRGFSQDGFVRGQAIHRTLLTDFSKLDAAHAALAAAVAAHQRARPSAMVTQAQGEPLVRTAVDEALTAVEILFERNVDVARYTRSVERVAQATESLRALEPSSPWAKIMEPPLDVFVRAARASMPASGGPVDDEARVEVGRVATALVEARGRAIARAVQFPGQ